MQILFWFVLTVHVIVCLVLIFVVLIQQGRSADLAGAFGGQGSQTAFGPRAAGNILTRVTTWSAILFMCTSIGLVVLFVRGNTGTGSSVTSGIKTAPVSAPAKPGK
jgi:preprotein translocase subunit SecG